MQRSASGAEMDLIEDSFGFRTTVGNTDALEAFDRVRRGVLSHGTDTMSHLDAALAHDPGFACAHAVKGLLMLTLARRELVPAAEAALAAARRSLAERGGTARERAYADALAFWLVGDMTRASGALDAMLQNHAADTLAMKLVQAIRFMAGDQLGMLSSIERVCSAIAPDHPDLGYVLGCRSFALEEAGEYTEAEKAGRRAVELAPDDAWGIHAVAHVLEMNRRAGEGIAWINRHQEGWERSNNFRFHVYWHLALFHLERREYDIVLDIYDRHSNAVGSDDYRDIANSASLLARLNLEGIDCGSRWQDLADLAAHRLDDAMLDFADLHFLISMAGAGRLAEADRLGMRIASAAAPGCCTTTETAALAARGLMAFAHADYPVAFANLSAAAPSLVSIGGSHAQRDVFLRIGVEAGLRAGAFGPTELLLRERGRRRPHSDDFADRRMAAAASHDAGPARHGSGIRIAAVQNAP
ncbi:MAG: tetratricopeptide repeat protein [Rhodobiaceae bacterium]|nr:tetratricopeptide repeat protein [Rhodobiaceae bacterium]